MSASTILPLVAVVLTANLSAQQPDRLQRLEERLAAVEAALNDMPDRRMPDIGRLRSSTVRVLSGLLRGTGFLVDHASGPLIVTNQHVLQAGQPVSVVIGDTLRVAAGLLHQDVSSDLAALGIPVTACLSCEPLQLSDSVSVGESVLSLGYSSVQFPHLSMGVVGGLTATGITSDIVLNAGDSGGPLVNSQGEVVGVNTFYYRTSAGTGIPGAVSLDRLETWLSSIPADLPRPTGLAQLPMLDMVYPRDLLDGIADTLQNIESHAEYWNVDASRFTASFSTPVLRRILLQELERRLLGERREREAAADAANRLRLTEPYRVWSEHIGNPRTAAVAIQVVPKLSETNGSVILGVFTRAFGVPTPAKYRYEGDLLALTLRRNGVAIPHVIGGLEPLTAFRASNLIDMHDVAMSGLFVFDPRTFYPDVGGLAPRITLELLDLKHPSDTTVVVLEPPLVARLWNDFAPVYLHDGEPLFAMGDVSRNKGIVRQYEAEPIQILEAVNELGYIMVRQTTIVDDSRWYLRPPDSERVLRVTVRRSRNVTGVIVPDDPNGNHGLRFLERLDEQFNVVRNYD